MSPARKVVDENHGVAPAFDGLMAEVLAAPETPVLTHWPKRGNVVGGAPACGATLGGTSLNPTCPSCAKHAAKLERRRTRR